MKSALLSIRTDTKTKDEVTKFAHSLGLTVSSFATIVLKQAVNEGALTISPKLEPTPYLENIIHKAEIDLKAKRNISSPMNREEARRHLKSLM